MAKKRMKGAKVSPFWKPTIQGQQIEGIFQGYERTEKAVCMRLDSTLVTMGTVLRAFFKPVYRNLKSGKSKIRIVYVGETDKKYAGGNKAHLFEVYLDSKALVQSFDADKMDSKQTDEFFSSRGGKKEK